MVKAYDYQLTEDYYVVQIRPLPDEAGTLSAAQLIAEHGPAIARAFVLEVMVVVILIIELIYFFRGKG